MVVICEASEIQSLWGNIAVAKELQNILNILLSLCQGACGNLKQWLVNLFHLEVLQNWCHTIFNHALHEWPPQRDWQACFTSCNCTCPWPLDGSLNLVYLDQVSLFPLSLLFDKKGHYPDHNSWSWSSTWTAIMTITRIVMMIFTWTVLWLYIPAILFDFKIMMLIFLWIIINPCYFSSPMNSLLNIKVAIMFTLLFIIFVITMTIRDMILHQKKTSLQTPSRLSSSWTPCS